MTLLHQAAQKAVEALKPCPLCGCAMSVRTSRDWHRLVGEHAEGCMLQDFEPYYAATPEDRDALVAAWNQRHGDAALQEVPREPVAHQISSPKIPDTLLGLYSAERVRAMLAASPSTTQQQEAGSDSLDARRYRWLRQYGLGIYWDVFNDDEAMSLGTVESNAARLDSAIDKVLAAAPSTPAREEALRLAGAAGLDPDPEVVGGNTPDGGIQT